MAPFKKLLSLFIFLLFLFNYASAVQVNAKPHFSAVSGSKYLEVPLHEFENSVYSAITSVRNVGGSLMSGNSSNMNNGFAYWHSSNATSDCLEMLESTEELLNWSLSALQDSQVDDAKCRTGDVKCDVQTWLSGALANQATCMDELVTTNHIAKHSVEATMHQVTATIQNLLSMLQHVPSSESGSSSWIKPKVFQLIRANRMTPNVTVAADGSGNTTNITEAIQNAPKNSNYSYIIYIKKGLYNQIVEIKKNRPNIIMIGDGINQTIISGSNSNATGFSTFRSATFAVSGCKFIAINITFENRAGEQGFQAVALRSDADQSIFYQCEFRGYQDTLYLHSKRQFYRECKIRGTIDFIFGDGTVVFQKCDILARQRHNRTEGLVNTITAQGRECNVSTTGFSFQLCNITGDSDLMSSKNRTRTYLGRPWRAYSRVVIMESTLSDVVDPKGWKETNSSFDSTVFYAEYNNSGAGSDAKERVKWPGVHISIDRDTAKRFTVWWFINGGYFIPSTDIPYVPELEG